MISDKEYDALQKKVDREMASLDDAKIKMLDGRRGLAKWVVDYYCELKNARSNWDTMWQELSEMFLPRKSTVYDYDSNGDRLVRLFDITGVISNDEFASSLHFTLTNPTIQFFEYSTGDIETDQIPEVAIHLQKLTQIDHLLLQNSNYQTEIHECYLDLGAFGTQVLRIDEDDDTVINFTSRPIYDFVIDEDHKGRIDTVGREKMFTARQLLQKFGGDKIFDNSHYYGDEKMQKVLALKKAEPTDKFKVFELFIPTKDIRKCGYKTVSRPYVNIYVLEDGQALIKQDGFNEQIYAVSRWSKSSDEVYGRGPGHKAMPAMLMLNELARLVVQAGQLATKPPVLLPDDGTYGGFNIYPGAINWYRAGTRDEITAFNPNPNVAVADFIVQKLVDQIRQAFMLDKFRIPQNDRMTREEVLIHQQENLRFTSPILGRQEQESLAPTILRLHAIGERRGLYPPPPKELEGKPLEVKYASQVSRVQKSALADNASMFVGEVIGVSTQAQKPEILDNINWDKYVSYLAMGRSAPAALLTGEEERGQVREERAMMMEDQMAQQEALNSAQIAQQSAKASSDIAQADIAAQGEMI